MGMKPLFLIYPLFLAVLSGCNGWAVQPIPNNVTISPLPSQTPIIHTATPVVIPPPHTPTELALSLTPTQSTDTVTPIVGPTTTETPASPTVIPTLVTIPSEFLKVEVLGCNTGLDITHGMGTVTNAYVTMDNLGPTDLENVCATLRGQDEGRPHPDKTKCISSLPGGSQVTLKLTIDTTYNQNSPIQVEVTSNNALLQRLGEDSCKAIDLFSPDIDDLGVVKRIP
jgi:hypothetical protein